MEVFKRPDARIRTECSPMIFQDAIPHLKTFLKPAALRRRAQALVIRCIVAFLMHRGTMSASQAAGSIRTEARHRAQISRFFGRGYWKRTDLLGPLCAALIDLEAQRDGLFIFDVDQTYCTQQGQRGENTFSCGNYRKRPRKSNRKQKKTARRAGHCFVMGLLITPSGIRIPFSTSFYTKDYCQKKRLDFRTQAELGAQLIRQLPVPEGARVMVLGDTAFEAQSIRAACAERKFHWIMPLNPERVLAGAKPRPKVRSLAKELHADQMVHLEVHPNRGKYVAYRRIARCRIGPKLKPRTYYVHQEIRDVHSVGEVRLVFSTTKAPLKDQGVDVQKILMTDDLTLSLQDVIELYQLRWQIESFFKELEIDAGPVPVPVPAVRDGGDVGAAGPGEFHLSGVGASPPVEETVAQGEGVRLVAGAADLWSGRSRARIGGAEGVEAAGGCLGDTLRAKTPEQAPWPVASQGVPCRDMIIGSLKKAQLQKMRLRKVQVFRFEDV